MSHLSTLSCCDGQKVEVEWNNSHDLMNEIILVDQSERSTCLNDHFAGIPAVN